MNNAISGQQKFEALNDEYALYIEKIRRGWLPKNQINSNQVYEVMYPHERKKVDEKISEWSRYIAPIGEAWWKERGYGVIWPEDDSKPMQVYELETVN